MASCVDKETDALYLRQQLVIARNEINNLRQQIRSLGISHQKDVNNIQNVLESWRCSGCRVATSQSNMVDDFVPLRPIGVVSTWFPDKRGTPRQSGICASSKGKLTLSNTVFTNPEHALEGLEDFSHMWILFHFHKNNATHLRAKVSPPRLNGARTGVFGTRSPNRPSPIGLSLVSIDRVEGPTVYFSGVDMVDGTPVLDIKPYIPQYDSPQQVSTSNADLRLMDGCEGDDTDSVASVSGDVSGNQPGSMPAAFHHSSERVVAEGNTATSLATHITEREAPDGEEETTDHVPPVLSPSRTVNRTEVRVPDWVTHCPLPELSVTFSERARAQLENLTADTGCGISATPEAIASVLQEDPRSVYLRRRWGSQFFTFLISGLHVSCKFDDSAHSVTVFQVRPAGRTCECGLLEWQCSIHGNDCE